MRSYFSRRRRLLSASTRPERRAWQRGQSCGCRAGRRPLRRRLHAVAAAVSERRRGRGLLARGGCLHAVRQLASQYDADSPVAIEDGDAQAAGQALEVGRNLGAGYVVRCVVIWQTGTGAGQLSGQRGKVAVVGRRSGAAWQHSCDAHGLTH